MVADQQLHALVCQRCGQPGELDLAGEVRDLRKAADRIARHAGYIRANTHAIMWIALIFLLLALLGGCLMATGFPLPRR